MSSKTLLAATSYRAGNGGIARVARLTAKALVASGTERRIDAVSLLDDRPVIDLGIGIRVAHSSRLRFALALHRASASHLRFIYDFAGIARAHPRFPPLRRPFAVWMHGVEVWEDAREDRLRALRAADLVLCNSDHTRQRFEQLHGILPNVKICWLATEQDDAPRAREHRGPPSVLILGRLDEASRKGHKLLVDVWPKVVSAVPEARLVIVGGGGLSLLTLRDAARRSPVSVNIDIRGFVPEERMPEVWEKTTAFAMPSRGEGFGLVYVEAMRQSVPVIASIHDAGREVNIDGVTGYNVNLDHPAELEERLIHLLRDEDQARTLGRNAQAHWKEHFTLGHFTSRFINATTDFLR
jgi:phosphatidylinositol alpha-1,6-mannosyltransferase